MKQTSKLKTGDSLNNWIMSNNSTVPKAAEYCIEIQTLDRTTHIVKEVINPKEVVVEYCNQEYDETKGECGMGHQNWKVVPTGQFFTLKYKWGAWRTESGALFRCLFSDKIMTYRCWEF